MIVEKDLISRMRSYRAAHNMSIYAFAQYCGLHPQTVVRIEQGFPVHMSSILSVERALGTSDDECSRIMIEYSTRQRKMYRVAHAEYYKRNRETILEQQRKYYRDTAEKRAKDRAENPEKYRAKEAEKRRRRGEKLRAYQREYQRARRQRLKANAPDAKIEAPENTALAAPVPKKADD